MMNRYWNLRDEFYRLFHRWPAMLAFFALGCLAGWLLAYLWPAYFKASREIYVGLNAYRTYSDANFLALAKPRYSNIDNYHYWQMNQLDTILVMDALLQETLDDLREQDPYWENLDIQGLRDLLDTDWRTAGEWSLSVSHPDQGRARQALEAWSNLALERAQVAVSAARDTFIIDQELEQIAGDLFSAQKRLQALAASRAVLQSWQQKLRAYPEGQSLLPAERWQIFSAAASLALDDPAWRTILANQPSADSAVRAYRIWIPQVLQQIEQEMNALPDQITMLEEQRDALKEKYSSESANSLGLSPNLEFQQIGPVSTQVLRPTTTLILVGGFVGLLVWIFVGLIRITRRVQARD
jgi:hypothetical protein